MLRFYVVLQSATEKNENELLQMPIEVFAEEAERAGYVFDLHGLKKGIGNMPKDAIMRVAIVENGVIKEVRE